MPGHPGKKTIALAMVLVAGAFASPAASGPWSLGAGGGWSSQYDPFGRGDISSSRGTALSSWLSTIAVEREIKPTARFKVELARLRFEGTSSSFDGFWFAPAGSYAVASYADEHRASFLPIAAGLRWNGSLGRAGIAPYLEFMPTVFLVSWEERATGE